MNRQTAVSTHVCRVLLFCLVLLAITLVTLQARSGFRIDTSFTAMVPVAQEDQETAAVLAAARDQGDQGIILLLESANSQQLERAALVITEQIKSQPGLLELSTSVNLPESVLELIRSNQFYLLSHEHRQQILSDSPETFLGDTISDLYSTTGEFRLLEFNADPFNTVGSFVEEKINKNLPQTLSTQRVIKLSLKEKSQEHGAQQILNTLFSSLDVRIKSEFADVNLSRSGVYFFAQHAAIAAKKDINFISTGSMLGLVLLLILVFRSIWPVVMPVVSILVGVLVAFAIVHAVYGSVHVFTIVFGASLIGIVIDYSIHYFFHVAKIRGATDKHSGFSHLLRALLVSLVSSVVGYAALALSGVELLEKIAVFSVCGVLASWLTVLSLSPLVEHKVKLVDPVVLRVVYRFMETLASGLRRLLSPVLFSLCMVVSIVIIAVAARGQDDPRRFIKLPQSLLAESQLVASAFHGIEPGRFLLVKGNTEQTIYDILEQFYGVTDDGKGLLSLLDWLPSPKQQQENYQLNAQFYLPDALAARLLEALGMDTDLAAQLATNYQNAVDQRLSAITLFSRASGELPTLIQRGDSGYYSPVFVTQAADIEQLKSAAQAIEGLEYIDSVAQSMAQLKRQRRVSAVMLLLAYGVVGVLLLLLYKRFSSLKMLILPATATLLTALILVLSGVSFTLFHTMAFFLILGLGMDYSVFLTEMTSDRHATLQAILLSALTSMLSFGLLSLSGIPVAQAFGVTVFLGSCLNLAMAFALAQPQHVFQQPQKAN